MKYTIHLDPIEINCGEKTCASKKGSFCSLLEPSIFGGGKCDLFGKLEEQDGWIQRHPDCINRALKRESNEIR